MQEKGTVDLGLVGLVEGVDEAGGLDEGDEFLRGGEGVEESDEERRWEGEG